MACNGKYIQINIQLYITYLFSYFLTYLLSYFLTYVRTYLLYTHIYIYTIQILAPVIVFVYHVTCFKPWLVAEEISCPVRIPMQPQNSIHDHTIVPGSKFAAENSRIFTLKIQWLEDVVFPIEIIPFLGDMLVFRGCK